MMKIKMVEVEMCGNCGRGITKSSSGLCETCYKKDK